MNNDELNEWLAVNVMGWKTDVVRTHDHNGCNDTIYYEADDGEEIHEEDWSPTTNIAQAHSERLHANRTGMGGRH